MGLQLWGNVLFTTLISLHVLSSILFGNKYTITLLYKPVQDNDMVKWQYNAYPKRTFIYGINYDSALNTTDRFFWFERNPLETL